MATKALSVLKERLQEAIGDHELLYAGNYTNAINNAARELYPYLFRELKIDTLILGNALPNSHFEDWSSTSYPDEYSAGTTNTTLSEKTTAGYTRGGHSSCFVQAGANDSYMYIDSDDYPQLLDLKGKTINFKCWAMPSTADEPELKIIYTDEDGTATTATSTTSAPADIFTLLEIENQEIPADTVKIELQLNVQNSGESCYFDNARITNTNVYEYLLPVDFRDGKITQVLRQTGGQSDDPCDDIGGHAVFEPVYGWTVVRDGTDAHLRMPYVSTSPYLFRLIGYAPLEDTLSADTDTMTIEAQHVNLLIARAAHLLYEMEAGIVSSGDRDRLRTESQYWYAKSKELEKTAKMILPQSFTRFR